MSGYPRAGLGPATPLPEIAGPIDAARFAAIRAGGRPVVLRAQAADWPAVAAACEGDESIVGYLAREPMTRPVRAIAAPPSENGRFFYNRELTGFNFQAANGRLDLFLADLLRARNLADVPAMAVQSEEIADLLPGFAAENRLALLPGASPRIWIGNRIRVAPHFDLKENVAVCVAGRRRFTLFPPAQIANLYPGPLEQTPAGTPVSMVDQHAPDLARYPRYAQAWQTAQQATLEPGDAIYIPYCWWHGVESLEPVSILVNYWWNEGAPEGAGSPYDAMLHAMSALKHLPREQRDVWRGMLDYYVFEAEGDPAAHLPEHARGMLGRPGRGLFANMRAIVREALR
jgi:hypothetical protein